jgi:hypothetical protein|tara:strand:+ start:1188 stop:1427 length:240 start_codon:yes stop_codon:yes gene_type:complete
MTRPKDELKEFLAVQRFHRRHLIGDDPCMTLLLALKLAIFSDTEETFLACVQIANGLDVPVELLEEAKAQIVAEGEGDV